MLSKEQKRRVLDALNTDNLYKNLSSPEEFHQFSMYWNWDGGLEPLVWIIKQSNCDLATALLIYWKGGPDWYGQFANREEVNKYSWPGYDLIMEVESKVMNGFYDSRNISFDPTNSEGIDWTQQYSDIFQKRVKPVVMFQKINGAIVLREELIEKSFEGIPPYKLDEVNGKILKGFRLLQEKELSILPDASPRDIVVVIKEYVDVIRNETKGQLTAEDEETFANIGWVFSEQVRREYGWNWKFFIYGDEKEINLFSADNKYIIKPFFVIVPLIVRYTWENNILRFFDTIGAAKTTQEFRDFYAESMIFLMHWK